MDVDPQDTSSMKAESESTNAQDKSAKAQSKISRMRQGRIAMR
jgi:hypothetical protein